METIFDHNITKEELEQIMGLDDFTPEDMNKMSQISNYGVIYCLYAYRGNKEKMAHYLSLIPNSDWKNFQLANHDNAQRNWERNS